MITWDQALTISQKLAQDTNSANVTFLNTLMNQGYKEILAELGRPVTEKTKTFSTVADQQAYQMPVDCNWIKSLTVTVGSTIYTPTEEESQEQWNYLNSQTRSGSVPEVYFVRPGFGYQGTELLIYPTPSAVNTGTVVYEAIEKDLSATAYTTGTITATNASAAIVGSGTTFTAAMVGRYLQITSATGDALWYRIASFTSTTSITLENVYQGLTVSGVNFQICEAFGLPEDLHMLPIYYALWHYSDYRRDKPGAAEYSRNYLLGLTSAKRRYGTKTRSNIIKGGRRSNIGGSYPSWFPSNIV